MKFRPVPLIAAATLSMALAACEQPETASAQPVAATVGNQLISEAELERALARLGSLGEMESVQARGKVLDALIDQHLVSNAARAARLDREPEVALALQQAQRQVLVEAYMERMFKNMAKPVDTDIQSYYTRHPELFSARRVYRIQELDLQLPPSRLPEVEAQLKQSRNLAGFAEWLKTQGIDGKAGLVVRAAEQIPDAVLARLATMKDGQTTVQATGPDTISVVELQDSRLQPVTLEQAAGAIERILQREQRQALLETEIRKLRSAGKVEYASGFSPAASSVQVDPGL